LKDKNSGFKPASHQTRSCYDCDHEEPPIISHKVIRNLGENFCKVESSKLSMASLSSSKTTQKAISKPTKSAQIKVGKSKDAKKPPNEDKNGSKKSQKK
jgi:hypothetical protein